MMARALLAWLAATVLAAPLAAQEKKDDRFEKALFGPELVLRYAKEIGLTQPQRQTILEITKKTQTELVPLQLDMAEPAMELVDLLDQERVDEGAAVAKADQVLKIENEVKKKQMAFLIKIKNVLTKDQQSRLRVLRDGGKGTPDGDANHQEESSQ